MPAKKFNITKNQWRDFPDIDERFMDMECKEGDFREMLQVLRHRYGIDHVWTQACFSGCGMMPYGYEPLKLIPIDLDAFREDI